MVPAPMRSASIGSTRRRAHVPEQRDGRAGQRPFGGQLGAKRLELRRRRQTAMPEQPRRLLERRVAGELADREAGDDQFAAFAIDVD